MIKIKKNDNLLIQHSNYLVAKLDKRIDNILKDGFFKKSKKEIHFNKDIEIFLNIIKLNLNIIVSANNEELVKIINFFKFHYPCLVKHYKKQESKPLIYSIIYNIFVDNGYDRYLSDVYSDNEKKKEKEYHSYKLIKELGLKCCPYCNRSYISFVKNKEKQTRPQLDHYYPKAIYPFLACSFYNLIPSCSACNHMKSDDDSYEDEKNGELINPYNVEDKDFKFSYKLNDLKLTEIIIKDDISFDYEESIKIELKTKYKKNVEYFQLEEIYQNHKDVVIELILKEINYPKSYIEELIKSGFGSKEEIYRFLFSNYLELDDLHKRPLSKLTKDIVEELGLIEKIKLATLK